MTAENVPAGILQPHQTRGDVFEQCDVVVIGSGAGGATAAATLAEAGLDVLVLEEGAFHRTSDYGSNPAAMVSTLMRDGGATTTLGRAPVPYLEGRCVGGSTVINGGMCWRTPEEVLDRWAHEMRLPDLAPARMEPLFDEVEATINARYQDPGSEGGNNNVFRRGCEALGWEYQRNKRNQVHCVGSNDCVTGCPSGAKQSTVYSWLPRLFARGGRLMTHCKVTRILTERGRAVGVTGQLLDPHRKRRFTVRARAVVVAGGAVQTPVMLLRSGLAKRNPNLGRHFTIHPNIKLVALFDERVESLRGVHQAWQCVEFKKEGILMAPGGVPPAFVALAFNDFGRRLADRMRDYQQLATGGVLVDDFSSGRILAPFGVPVVRYDVTDIDQEKFVRAAGLLAKLYFTAGAREVYLPFHHFPVLKSIDDIKALEDFQPRVEDTEYFTAHLMGSCRMHGDPRHGVVDADGQCWDVPGLYLADASVMPGTIGVNPQVTIMALARLVAQRLGDRLAARRAA
jgi:choline dehydrogenase-like flavoprotein